MCTKLKALEKELEELKRNNRTAWDMYGSELCAGDMLRKEEILEEKINKMKKDEGYYGEDPIYIIDD